MTPINSYKNGTLIKTYESIATAIRDGFVLSSIRRCLVNPNKLHRDLTWKYKEVSLGT